MDAAVRRSSSRVHTLIALTVFASLFALFVLLDNAGTQPILTYTRRDIASAPQNSNFTETVLPGLGTSSATSLPSTRSSSSTSSTITSISTAPTSSHDSSATSSTSTSSPVDSSPLTSASSSSSSESTSSSSATSTSTSTPQLSSSSTQISTSISTSRTSSTTTRSHSSTETPFNPQPSLTLPVAPNLLPTTTPTPSAAEPTLPPEITNTPSPISAAATSSSFWQKKSAVAAVFVIASLVFLAAAAFVVIALLKSRSKRREDRLHEELFEKYSEHDHRSSSPGPSINAAPLDPFASAETGFSQSNPFHGAGEVYTARSITPVQHPDYYGSEKSQTTPSRYMPPSQHQNAQTLAPPTAFRHPLGRTTTARISQPVSIDSFYGAAGQPPSTGYAL